MTEVAVSRRYAVDSGKGADDENFPVASRLLAPAHRAAVMRFYRFARAADDVADAADLTPADKHISLDALEAQLRPGEVGTPHARALLVAFHRDADNQPCETWDDLYDYCRYSAAPVGHFLTDLHGENAVARAAGGDLAMAMQVLNHLQDCADDWRALKRLYLPQRLLAENGLDADCLLKRSACSGLRRVMDALLEHTDVLLAGAAPLVDAVRDCGLAAQSRATLELGHRLRRRLALGDPLTGRVKLELPDWVAAGVTGIRRGGWPLIARLLRPAR